MRATIMGIKVKVFNYGVGFIGDIRPFIAGPNGGWDGGSEWMPCDGRILEKKDYPELHAVIGYQYGEYQYGRQFRIPDLRYSAKMKQPSINFGYGAIEGLK